MYLIIYISNEEVWGVFVDLEKINNLENFQYNENYDIPIYKKNKKISNHLNYLYTINEMDHEYDIESSEEIYQPETNFNVLEKNMDINTVTKKIIFKIHFFCISFLISTIYFTKFFWFFP